MTIHKVKVWDWPIRLFHWLLVTTLIFQYVTAEILEDALQWHFYAGYFCIGLILFRILWGIIGTYYARFSQFVSSPRAVLSYIANKPVEHIGHNPAGGYSVLLMLALFLSQALSGLFINDDIFSEGPYYGVLSKSWQSVADFVHHNGFNAILVIVTIHISAIVYYQIKHKQNLARAMLTGYKKTSCAPAQAPQVGFYWLRLLLCLVIVAIIMYFLLEVWPPPVEDFYY